MKNFIFAISALPVTLLTAGQAFAAQPVDWQIRFQPPATPIAEEIVWFEALTLWFIIPISLLVLGLIVYVALRFRASANPVPSRTSHNTTIEVIWTIAPVVILLFIAVPSFQLLSAEFEMPEEPAVTIKATGYQWYWGYEYQAATDNGEEPTDVRFDQLLLLESDREAFGKTDASEYPRLLAVDNEVVVPVGQTVRMLITAGDVLHSWAIPAFGVKMDAVPGRLNETWFLAQREGLYYGQCSELCGKDHAYMPIAVRVVSVEQYNEWATQAVDNIGAANEWLRADIAAARSVDVAQNAAE